MNALYRAHRLRSLRLYFCSSLVLLSSVPGTCLATPVISEVFYDAVGGDDSLTFVELAGAPGTSLDGWTFEGVNGSGGGVTVTVALFGEIPFDGLFVVADIDGGGATGVAGADLLANFDLQNGPDSVVLRDPDGAIFDAVGYGVFDGTLVFAGEGAPVADAPAGSSVARAFADVDTDDNALDFGVLAVPTPGAAEFQSVPEPSSGVLAVAGLGTLAWLGRRPRAAPAREESQATRGG